jgi:hypothetical protein
MTAHVIHEFDLTAHEVSRRAEVLKAVGVDWDPITLMREEAEAYGLLYSRLDPQQQKVRDELRAAGVLP